MKCTKKYFRLYSHFWKKASTQKYNIKCSILDTSMVQMSVWTDLWAHFWVCLCFRNECERTFMRWFLSISMFRKFYSFLKVLPQNPIEIYLAPFHAIKYCWKERFVENRNNCTNLNTFNYPGKIYYISQMKRNFF